VIRPEVGSPLAPLAADERIVTLDVLRGVAVLGILAMNVQSLAMPAAAYFFPTAFGDLTGANRVVWLLADVLAFRKFMTVFAILFGAGMVLMHERGAPAGLHVRRMLWLWALGLLHAYLLWPGDILVSYAVCGLALTPCRRWRAATQATVGLLCLTVGSGLAVLAGLSAPHWPAGLLEGFHRQWQPDAASLAHEIALARGPWAAATAHRAPGVLMLHGLYLPFAVFWRAGGGMLLGMALYRGGWLTGRRPLRAISVASAACVVPGLAATVMEIVAKQAAGWEPVRSFFLASQWGYWGSLPLALGYVGGVVLAVRTARWRPLTGRLAAVGRLALTNYLAQTVLVSALMAGWGLGLFGRVSRVEQAAIVVAVWALQLWWSPVWLDRFRFGPAEWLWRSLTYARRPTLRRRPAAT